MLYVKDVSSYYCQAEERAREFSIPGVESILTFIY